MADYADGGEAADQLEEGMHGDPEGAPGPEGVDGEGREDTFFLPPDFPGADMLKPGDMLNLRVVGKDADGGIEVEHVPMKGEEDWRSDLKRSVPNVPGGGGIGNGPEM